MADETELTPGQKAARTRKRRAAGKKAAITRKRREAGEKAAVTRKRNEAAIKAAATRKIGMRVTPYATEEARASTAMDSSEARIERLIINSTGLYAIRFSWWTDGRLVPRPLDMTEDQFVSLVQAAISADPPVLTDDLRTRLRAIL